MKKRIVVLTGAGVSAESGFATFRDSGGLWEQYNVEDVASHDGWLRNPGLVLDFYNARRAQLKDAKPNAAHLAIAGLEKDYDVDVITQNVDNLHEKAGSTRVLHLHGELTKVRPEKGIYDISFQEDEDDRFIASKTAKPISRAVSSPPPSSLMSVRTAGTHPCFSEFTSTDRLTHEALRFVVTSNETRTSLRLPIVFVTPIMHLLSSMNELCLQHTRVIYSQRKMNDTSLPSRAERIIKLFLFFVLLRSLIFVVRPA